MPSLKTQGNLHSTSRKLLNAKQKSCGTRSLKKSPTQWRHSSEQKRELPSSSAAASSPRIHLTTERLSEKASFCQRQERPTPLPTVRTVNQAGRRGSHLISKIPHWPRQSLIFIITIKGEIRRRNGHNPGGTGAADGALCHLRVHV